MVFSQLIDSALKVCQEFLEGLEHNDIDISLETPQTLTKEEWAKFIDSFYLVVQCVPCTCVTEIKKTAEPKSS